MTRLFDPYGKVITSSVGTGVSGASKTVTVSNGDPVRVYGISFSSFQVGASTVDITFNSGDGTSTYFTLRPVIAAVNEIPIFWIADKGLSIVLSNGGLLSVWVTHSHPGS